MCFIYIFRDKKGAKCEATIEADSREAAFASLKAKGISPLGLHEGGKTIKAPKGDGGSKYERIGTKGSRANGSLKSIKIFLVTLPILGILGVVAWWWFATRMDTHTPEMTDVPHLPSTVKAVASTIPRRPSPVTSPSVAPAPVAPATSVKRRQGSSKDPPLLTNIKENVHGRRTPRPVKVIASGQIDKDGNPVEPPKPLFEAMGDNHIEQLVNYQPGERFLAIVEPAQIARDFKAHMDDPIVISPDDPPEVAERKRNYMEVRKAIIEDMRKGADLEEMILEARRTLDKIARMREQYAAILAEERKAGTSDDDLDDLASAASALLKQHGANPILSPRQEDLEMMRREEEAAKKAAETLQKEGDK